MSEFENLLKNIFSTAFYCGRVYTFEHKDSVIENIDTDIETLFWRCENIRDDEGVSWLDLVKDKILIDKDDLDFLIDISERCLKAASRGGEHWDRLREIKARVGK